MSPRCRKLCREIAALRCDVSELIRLQAAEPMPFRDTQINERIGIICALEMELIRRRRMTEAQAYRDFVRRLADGYAIQIVRSN
jgi:hypothetical protein